AYETIQDLIEQGEFTPENKKIAFIVEDTDYGRSNVEAAVELFNEDGWEQVAFETVEVGYTDFYPQLTKLNSEELNVLISVFTAVSSGVALTKQLTEMKHDALHLGIFYPTRPEFIEQAGEDAEGLLWLPLMFEPNLNDKHKEFAEIVEEKYDDEATSDHAYGYDTMSIALNSIQEAGSLDADDIVAELAETRLESLLGIYDFDEESHTVQFGPDYLPVPASQIQDGQNEIIYPENVATKEYKPQPWLK